MYTDLNDARGNESLSGRRSAESNVVDPKELDHASEQETTFSQ